MKEINIGEVFCEILSGFTVILLVIPLLDLTQYSNLEKTSEFIFRHFNGATLAGGIAVCYLLGLIMDAVGLGVGESFLDSWVKREGAPTEDERNRFWQETSAHALNYRNKQWAYYSTYRNLFLLLIPGGIFWVLALFLHGKAALAFWLVLLLIFIEWCFWRTMVALLGIYYTITKAI